MAMEKAESQVTDPERNLPMTILIVMGMVVTVEPTR
jgi:hypothetical protein